MESFTMEDKKKKKTRSELTPKITPEHTTAIAPAYTSASTQTPTQTPKPYNLQSRDLTTGERARQGLSSRTPKQEMISDMPLSGPNLTERDKKIKDFLDKKMESGRFEKTPEEAFNLIKGFYTDKELEKMGQPVDEKTKARRQELAERRISGTETAKVIPQWMKDTQSQLVTVLGKDAYHKFDEGPLAGAEYLASGKSMPVEEVKRISAKNLERPSDYIDRTAPGGEKVREFTGGELKGLSVPRREMMGGGEFEKYYEKSSETPGGYARRELGKELGSKPIPVKYGRETFEGKETIPGFYDPRKDRFTYAPTPDQPSSKDTNFSDIEELTKMDPKKLKIFMDNLQKNNPRKFLELSNRFSSYLGR